jgi:sugar/nucleoside kinase (ribokinase family)
MSAIFLDLIENVLPASPPRPDRIFFFDLADPEKRTRADLTGALSILGRFEKHGRVTLGLNLKEAQQVFNALGFGVETEAERGLRAMASRIRGELGVSTVVIHPKESAACATSAGTWWVPGPYAAQPLITTGAGDHFNAGFSSGQLMGLDPESCLYLGVSTSGHYVRTARSPTLADLETFLANWHG